MISFRFNLSSVLNYWVRLGLALLLGLLVLIIPPTSEAIATVHTYSEGVDQVMQRSLQTLRDDADQAWQLVFFKRVTAGADAETRLRLVGFPTRTTIDHSQPLTLDLGHGEEWTAPDVTPAEFGINVGEYDIASIIQRLDSNAPLRFKLALSTGEQRLLIPPFIVREWRQVQAWQPD